MDSVFWRSYLAERKGTYEFRCSRYRAVASWLWTMGMLDGDSLLDVGAGMCEFGRFLYTEGNWSGQYIPVDGSIDGTDLNVWIPRHEADYIVCIEVLEHLNEPERLMNILRGAARRGIVITTPNAATLGEDLIRRMDRTHVTPLYPHDITDMGGEVYARSLFGKEADTLIGVWNHKA